VLTLLRLPDKDQIQSPVYMVICKVCLVVFLHGVIEMRNEDISLNLSFYFLRIDFSSLFKHKSLAILNEALDSLISLLDLVLDLAQHPIKQHQRHEVIIRHLQFRQLFLREFLFLLRKVSNLYLFQYFQEIFFIVFA